MPYIGQAGNFIGQPGSHLGNLTVTGNIKSGGQLTANDTLFKMIMDTAADLGDNFLIEDGGTDGSGTNAGDDICLEKDLQVIPAGDIISISGVAGAASSTASGIDETLFDNITVAAGEAFSVIVIGAGGGGGGGTNAGSLAAANRIGGAGSIGQTHGTITFNVAGTLTWTVSDGGAAGAGNSSSQPGGAGAAGSGTTILTFSDSGVARAVITIPAGLGGAGAGPTNGGQQDPARADGIIYNDAADVVGTISEHGNWSFVNRDLTVDGQLPLIRPETNAAVKIGGISGARGASAAAGTGGSDSYVAIFRA